MKGKKYFDIVNGKLIKYNQAKNTPKVIIPDGVTEIENLAFYYCNKITEVVIPNSVKKLDMEHFFVVRT